MKIELTSEQVSFLRKLHKSQKDKVKADRIKIILLLNQGYTNEQVADILVLDSDTVSKWKHIYIERVHETEWLNDNYKPYMGKLSYKEISWLRSYINTFKVPNKKELINFISDRCNVTYENSGMQKLLHRIKFSHKMIHKLPGGLNIEKQREFIAKIETIISELKDNQAIVFIDSVHPQHNSNNSKMWIETGKERWIQSNTGREHLNINGAYNPLNQDITIVEDTTINNETTINLLKKVSEKYADKELIYGFADNATYNKNKKVKLFLDSQTKIKMIYLPPYSPNLNLIERLWKIYEKKVINLKYYATVQQCVNSFFNSVVTKVVKIIV